MNFSKKRIINIIEIGKKKNNYEIIILKKIIIELKNII